jgi:hypothetical protein
MNRGFSWGGLMKKNKWAEISCDTCLFQQVIKLLNNTGNKFSKINSLGGEEQLSTTAQGGVVSGAH